MIPASYPPVADVLPHRGPMVLLTAIGDHRPDRTICTVEIREYSPFREPGGLVPSWVGVEYMAQCIAAHRGLRARSNGEPIKVGFLIGAKCVDFHTPGFAPGQVLEVRARHLWGEREFAAFACSVIDTTSAAVLAEGTLTVYLPDDLEPFRRGRPRPGGVAS